MDHLDREGVVDSCRTHRFETLFLTLCLGLVLLAPRAAWAQTPPIELPVLTGNALVVMDGDGIPHICSGNDRDTILLQGYLHAQDRFFQMDTLRRTFSGTLAELVGAPTIPQDIELRTLGLRRAAEESWQVYQARGLDETVVWLEAYAEGVNLFLASNPLPPEYAALELSQVAPWTTTDSLVIAKGLAFGLSFDLLDIELTTQAAAYSAAGAALGFDGMALFFEDVSRTAPFDDTVSLPGAKGAPVAPATAVAVPSERTAALARGYRDKAAAVPQLQKALAGSRGDTGSNWWIVSGSRTTTGHAMLANDPHLALDTPATWYEVHLIASDQPNCGLASSAAGGSSQRFGAIAETAEQREAMAGTLEEPYRLNANGVSFAGVPGVVLGCNETICWGATVNPMDVTDIYQEELVLDPQTGVPIATIFEDQQEPLEVIPQIFLVNQPGNNQPDDLVDAGIGPLDGGLTLVVPRRNRGPIVQIDTQQLPIAGLSVQYTGWRGTVELEAFRRFQHAQNVDDFVDGLQFFDVGSQNFAYADVAGNIAYFVGAEMPIREDLQTLGFPDGGVPPFQIRDGTHALRHEWLTVQNPQPQQSLDFEILPFDEMPQIVNPAAGYVINANNDPIGTSLDNDPLNQLRPGGGLFYLSPGYVSLRVGRIGRLLDALLAGDAKVDMMDLEQMQGNNQLLDAELLRPFVVDAFANAAQPGAPAELQNLAADPQIAEAVNRLAAWDFSTPTGIPEGYDPSDQPGALQQPSAEEIAHSVAATIWSVFRGQLVRTVIDGTLEQVGLGDHLPGSRIAYTSLAHHLQSFPDNQGIGASGVDFFPGPLDRAENRDLILLGQLRAALDLLSGDEFAPAFGGSTEQEDYRWGRLHRIVFDHVLGGPFSIPPAGGFEDLDSSLPGLARAGGFEAVDASSHSARADGTNDFMFGSGASRRFIGELDPGGIDAKQIIPGGQSGVVASPLYASQLERWLTNSYHPLLLEPEDVDAAAVTVQQFLPTTCQPDPTTLCLRDRRFAVRFDWNQGGQPSPAKVVPGSSETSGNFYFFDADNWESLVKVLDGCSLNDHFWIFAAAATDLGWELTIEDTESGQVWSASNPLGRRAEAITDTTAFATCP
ncbi:MAG: penicillin acylase family protein [Thermoanaerobaculia bacterium]|nr:penicillin acylase family protein [Thermoanaerobaculia bacterium]